MHDYRFPLSRNGAPYITTEQIEEVAETILHKHFGEKFYKQREIDIDSLAEFDFGFDLEYAYLSHNQTYFGMMVFNDDTQIKTLKELYPTKDGHYELECLDNRANTILLDKSLCEDRYENLRRFTLGHECGHGILHQEYFYRDKNQLTFFDESPGIVACRKKDILSEERRIWTSMDTIEWQANTFSSCILMNKRSVDDFIRELGGQKRLSTHFYREDVINKLSEAFKVSKEAACVRLKVLKYISDDFKLYPSFEW